MINYKVGKVRYTINELGSLYIDESKLSNHEQPVIYIGGQMEHRGHVLEKTGFTTNDCHNLFTGSWMYDYPIFSKNKAAFNAKNFSKNLINSLKAAGLHDVVLITGSYGGSIAAYATKSEIIDRVIAVHPPIIGTPLANPKYLGAYSHELTPKQRRITKYLNVMLNQSYGFVQDNFNGIDLSQVNLNKLLVVGNNLDENDRENKILLELYDMVQRITTYKSDGILIFEPEIYESLGINFLQEETPTNHLQAVTKENMSKVYQKVMK